MFDSSKLPAEPGKYFSAKRKKEAQMREESTIPAVVKSEPDINYV